MIDQVTQAVRTAIPDARVFIDSPNGQHFQAVVVSEAFAGLPIVRQHRMVMGALREHLDSNRVHALQLKTMTPAQYESHVGGGRGGA